MVAAGVTICAPSESGGRRGTKNDIVEGEESRTRRDCRRRWKRKEGERVARRPRRVLYDSRVDLDFQVELLVDLSENDPCVAPGSFSPRPARRPVENAWLNHSSAVG